MSARVTPAVLAPLLGVDGGVVVVRSPEPDRLPHGTRGRLISLNHECATVDLGTLGEWGFGYEFDYLAPSQARNRTEREVAIWAELNTLWAEQAERDDAEADLRDARRAALARERVLRAELEVLP